MKSNSTKLMNFSNNQKTSSKSFHNLSRNKLLNKKNLTIQLGDPFPTHNIKQKEITKPRPVREYTRFLKSKIACTGMDTPAVKQEFMNKDIIKPKERPEDIKEYKESEMKDETDKVIDSKDNKPSSKEELEKK